MPTSLPRLYPIVDTGLLAASGVAVLDAAQAMLDAGARILQFRHKGPFSRQVFDQAAAVGERCRGAGALYVINDRPDIALLLHASGLHLGQDDLPPAVARRVFPASAGFLGFSTHNQQQFQEASTSLDAAGFAYVALGPIFSTRSKQNPDPVVGLTELRRLAAAYQRYPLVAIGGITLDLAPAVLDAGATSIAVISDLLPPASTSNPAAAIRLRTEQWLAAVSVL